MGLAVYQRAHVLAPPLTTYIHVPRALHLPRKAPSCYDQGRATGPCRSILALFTLQACAFSASRQPQFCARPDERKRDPKRRPQQQLQRRGPRRRAETPTRRWLLVAARTAPRGCEAGCRSMPQRGDWALAVAREPVPDPSGQGSS